MPEQNFDFKPDNGAQLEQFIQEFLADPCTPDNMGRWLELELEDADANHSMNKTLALARFWCLTEHAVYEVGCSRPAEELEGLEVKSPLPSKHLAQRINEHHEALAVAGIIDREAVMTAEFYLREYRDAVRHVTNQWDYVAGKIEARKELRLEQRVALQQHKKKLAREFVEREAAE